MERATAAMTALIRGELDSVQAIVGKDPATISWVDEHGTTLWHKAVDHGHLALVRELLRLGATVDQPGIDHVTAIHIAVRNRSIPLAQLLVDNGAHVNARDAHGNNAIWALVMGPKSSDVDSDRSMIEFLLANGADPTMENNSGHAALAFLKMPKNKAIAAFFSDWT